MKHQDKTYFYEIFAREFDARMNMYDTNKRLRIIFEEMLEGNELRGKSLLDAGCGTGWFSKKALELGADVTSMDVGDNLLAEVRRKCNSKLVKGNICGMEFADNTFDYAISTEVIEHTPNPRKALTEIHRVLKKKGIFLLTVPNKIWHFSVVVGNALRLRPYEGHENWVGWYQLKNWLREIGFNICDMFGFHVVPFVFPRLYGVIDYFDRYGRSIGPLMLNIAVKGVKKNNSC